MPSYRRAINRQKLYQLEEYLFRLGEYTDSIDFKDLKSLQQNNILKEIAYIDMAIGIFRMTFKGDNQEQPVVGWQTNNPNEADGYFKLYYFSCMKVASDCTGVDATKISAICAGRRYTSKGWKFKLRSDYEENDEPIDYSLDRPSFEIIEY
jgi:hypothetical protein